MPEGQPENGQIYAEIMGEIKLRLRAVETCAKGIVPLDLPVVKEFCFLQIRMICELTALACLVAHGDLVKTKKLKDEHAADKIIHALGKLHDDFFPRAVRWTQGPNGKIIHELKGMMTKEEMRTMYHQCGDFLHRGNVEKFLNEPVPRQIPIQEIYDKAQRIADLLAMHTVSMIGYTQHFICILNNEEGKVIVAGANATGKPGPLR